MAPGVFLVDFEWIAFGNLRSKMYLTLPHDVHARGELPATAKSSGVYIDDRFVRAQ
ncbi:MAG: hypothetical protein KDN22_01660 [Verrucomicrobiae bacterium]|nr:hypothetical protein [Verrucomicrobiae bacterium]